MILVHGIRADEIVAVTATDDGCKAHLRNGTSYDIRIGWAEFVSRLERALMHRTQRDQELLDALIGLATSDRKHLHRGEISAIRRWVGVEVKP